MYLSTEENVIKKITILPRTMQTCVLEVWKPLSNPADEILSMQYLKQTVFKLLTWSNFHELFEFNGNRWY